MNQNPEPLLPANVRCRQLAGLIDRLERLLERLLVMEQDFGTKLAHLDTLLTSPGHKLQKPKAPAPSPGPQPQPDKETTQMAEPPIIEPLLPADAIHATQAAKLLRTDVTVIHRWVSSGKLPGWRVGKGMNRRLWISLEDLKNMVARAEPKGGRKQPHAARDARLQREYTRIELAKHGLTPNGERIPRTKE